MNHSNALSLPSSSQLKLVIAQIPRTSEATLSSISSLGPAEGIIDGESLGPAEGVIDGTTEGVLDGYTLGPAEGITEGALLGAVDGLLLGIFDGRVTLGACVESEDGITLGLFDEIAEARVSTAKKKLFLPPSLFPLS